MMLKLIRINRFRKLIADGAVHSSVTPKNIHHYDEMEKKLLKLHVWRGNQNEKKKKRINFTYAIPRTWATLSSIKLCVLCNLPSSKMATFNLNIAFLIVVCQIQQKIFNKLRFTTITQMNIVRFLHFEVEHIFQQHLLNRLFLFHSNTVWSESFPFNVASKNFPSRRIEEEN